MSQEFAVAVELQPFRGSWPAMVTSIKRAEELVNKVIGDEPPWFFRVDCANDAETPIVVRFSPGILENTIVDGYSVPPGTQVFQLVQTLGQWVSEAGRALTAREVTRLVASTLIFNPALDLDGPGVGDTENTESTEDAENTE